MVKSQRFTLPEKISPEADAMVTSLSSINSRSFADLITVPASSSFFESSLLNIVTDPFAFSPTSFFSGRLSINRSFNRC